MKVWGYTRPLFAADDTTGDVDQLRDLGVDHVVVENGHRSVEARTGLLEELRPGDHLVVTSLERLAPRINGLIRVLLACNERGVVLRCAAEPALDTSSERAAELLTALADYSSRTISNQTKAGMRAGGKPPGRPPVLDATGIAMVLELRNVGRSIPHIARVLNVSRTTVHRIITDNSQRP